MNITEKIILNHLAGGKKNSYLFSPGEKIALKIDQTLTQDATGTLAYLQFESIGRKKVRTDLSVSYVDHNTLQTGFENADDHAFLRTFAKKYGIIFSPPGNGICHHLHLENFARPGRTLLGSDSHTPTAGAAGMLAIGAGGLDVAAAMAGEPFFFEMPSIINIVLEGKLSRWAGAKDVILFLLKNYTVKGGVKKIFEYSGSGLKWLDVHERSVISNMGAELGLTSSVFPSDEITRDFFRRVSRPGQWARMQAGPDAKYAGEIRINLAEIEPLIADSAGPDNVKSIREMEGTTVNQVCIGSCTNSSFKDLQTAAEIFRRYGVNQDVDLIVSPGSRQTLLLLEKSGALGYLIAAGARILEAACGPCIGMGCAPPTGGVSVRTFNRNFPGRSGTQDAQVLLSSVQTAAACAVFGRISDPRKLGKYPRVNIPKKLGVAKFFMPAKTDKEREKIKIIRGPNIKPLPVFKPLGDSFGGEVIIKLSDNISTDDILPAGAKILPLRSNIPAISEFTFARLDASFVKKAKNAVQELIIVAGENYGQGSSREHAAIVLRYLGVAAVIAKSFARIHMANLVNFGILPLVFENPADYISIGPGDRISAVQVLPIKDELLRGNSIEMQKFDKSFRFKVGFSLDDREKKILFAGGLLNYLKTRSGE